jgi:hypothetical protein
MPFADPPRSAAWRHLDAREGFEVVFLGAGRVEGETVAMEEGEAWAVRYDISVDAAWATRSARVWGHTSSGLRELSLEADGAGHWRVDRAPAGHLEGCLDVDLESSSLTNAFPVHRLGLAVGEAADAPAVYVRALDLSVERLQQRYLRLEDDEHGRHRYHYVSPAFAFECVLVYDESGLVLDYPGIAVRAA